MDGFPSRVDGFPSRVDGFPSRVDGFPSSVSCVDGFPSRVDGFPDIWKIFHQDGWISIWGGLGPFLDPPTLKVQYFFLVQPIVKTKSVLKSPCT